LHHEFGPGVHRPFTGELSLEFILGSPYCFMTALKTGNYIWLLYYNAVAVNDFLVC